MKDKLATGLLLVILGVLLTGLIPQLYSWCGGLSCF